MKTCVCWVSRLSPVDAFGVRYGAHDPACPIYRPSRDPVDARHDAELRSRMERAQAVERSLSRYFGR